MSCEGRKRFKRDFFFFGWVVKLMLCLCSGISSFGNVGLPCWPTYMSGKLNFRVYTGTGYSDLHQAELVRLVFSLISSEIIRFWGLLQSNFKLHKLLFNFMTHFVPRRITRLMPTSNVRETSSLITINMKAVASSIFSFNWKALTLIFQIKSQSFFSIFNKSKLFFKIVKQKLRSKFFGIFIKKKALTLIFQIKAQSFFSIFEKLKLLVAFDCFFDRNFLGLSSALSFFMFSMYDIKYFRHKNNQKTFSLQAVEIFY